MPEGPSIIILRELAQELKLEGKKVISAEGNTKIDLERLKGQKLVAFKSWGKHFLICFQDFTIRIHLLMFGSYRFNERKDSPVRLRLSFKGAELNFYTCSVKLLEGNIEDHYNWGGDIMSDEWDAKAAAKKLKSIPDTLVCDALLDQDIFAGVGNIIKNEVLYRVAVDPHSKVGDLPPAKTKQLIKEAQQYSFDFLKWKKENTLKSHWLIHTKKKCPEEHTVHKAYLGNTKRRSFFSTKCQNLYE